MKLMQKLCFLLLGGVSLSAVAEGEVAGPGGPGVAPKNFEEAKSLTLTMVDRRLAEIQEAKACITKATNHDEMRACRQEARHDMKQMRQEHREMRKGLRK